jgi:DNA-binding NtrC family response regulator
VRLEKSNLGGMMVTTIFPVLAEDEGRGESDTEPKKWELRRGRVLAIDDELIVLDTIRRGLGRAGYRVDTVSNQRDFSSLLESGEQEYAAAIIDIMMPDIIFEEMFEVLRQRFPTMPILISSGYTDLDLRELMKEEEHVMFLTKPYRVGDLLEAIGEVGAVPE